MRFQGFIGPSYQAESLNIDRQRCINLIPEINPTGFGKEGEVLSLISSPGLRRIATLPSGPIRGAWRASNGRFFMVGYNKLYEFDSAFVPTEVGTLNTTSGRVGIADNGLHLVIVDGNYGYVFTFGTNTFEEINDPAFPGANQVVYQDGYFIFNKPNSGQFFISGLKDITFEALDIAESEANPDNLVSILSDHRDLWLFNEQTTEVFFNSGAAAFPFERTQGAFIEHGCGASWSVAKANNVVFWVGKDDKGPGQVYMAQGYQAQKISTHGVDRAIQSYTDISNGSAFAYQDRGHTYYVLNFPTARTTWVYDSSSGLWHERAYTVNGEFERHRAEVHAFAFNTHVVGDYANAHIYALDRFTYTDDGVPITRQRISPHVSSGMKRVFYSSFELDIEAGVGLDGSGQGVDPKVMMQFSDDGGHTWSNEQWCDLGKIGQKRNRVIWNRLGYARDRVFKVSITDPVPVSILGAELTVEAGGS